MIRYLILVGIGWFGTIQSLDYHHKLLPESRYLCTIHSIGDSHAKSCFSNNPIDYFGYTEHTKFIINNHWFAQCMVNWIGSITMHRVGRDGLRIVDVRRLPIKHGDIVIFVFGEIDVRCHIGKQRDQSRRSLDEIIDTLVTNYLATVRKNKEFMPQAYTVIMGILPPTDQAFNHVLPFYGTLNDRIEITKLLNQRLSLACQDAGILFLDIYDLFANAQGALNPALSDGIVHVHVAHNYLLKQKLINMIYGALVNNSSNG